MVDFKLTEKDKVAVTVMRLAGIGYRCIAKALGVPRYSVRQFCIESKLTGRIEASGEYLIARNRCKNCGQPINVGRISGRPNKFCNLKCRREWEKRNPRYIHICVNCGKEFGNQVKRARFCSRKCAAVYRFKKNI